MQSMQGSKYLRAVRGTRYIPHMIFIPLMLPVCDRDKTGCLIFRATTSSIKNDGHEYERRLRDMFFMFLQYGTFVLYQRKLRTFQFICISIETEQRRSKKLRPVKCAWHSETDCNYRIVL